MQESHQRIENPCIAVETFHNGCCSTAPLYAEDTAWGNLSTEYLLSLSSIQNVNMKMTSDDVYLHHFVTMVTGEYFLFSFLCSFSQTNRTERSVKSRFAFMGAWLKSIISNLN